MEHKLNDKQLFNVQQQLNNMPDHAMLSFNMNQFKFVLFDNFNVLVLLKKALQHIFNVMEHHF
jgi:hypothetical protein